MQTASRSRKNSRKPDAAPSERLVVLLRHGIAQDPAETATDEERSLTEEGHARMKKIARGLRAANPGVDAVYSSGLMRALQTARWVSQAYGLEASEQVSDSIAPSAQLRSLVRFVRSAPGERIVVVGHEPGLTRCALALLGCSDAAEAFGLKKGGCYALGLQSDGTATLEFLLSPKLLRRLGRR